MHRFKAKLDLQYLAQIADFVEKSLKSLGCSDHEVISDLQLAIDEASTNIMTHGKETQKRDFFTIQINKEGNDIHIAIEDSGRPFSPPKRSTLPRPKSIDEMLSKGFGMGLIASVIDSTDYQILPDKNVLNFRKHLSKGENSNGN